MEMVAARKRDTSVELELKRAFCQLPLSNKELPIALWLILAQFSAQSA